MKEQQAQAHARQLLGLWGPRVDAGGWEGSAGARDRGADGPLLTPAGDTGSGRRGGSRRGLREAEPEGVQDQGQGRAHAQATTKWDSKRPSSGMAEEEAEEGLVGPAGQWRGSQGSAAGQKQEELRGHGQPWAEQGQ